MSIICKPAFMRLLGVASAAVVLAEACSSGQQSDLSHEALLDAQTCAGCHPEQYNEWAGSMHAYSSTDPVFLAMNRRGQRETNGALGNFCVNCHAPVAVHEGVTTDGLNLDQVPQRLKGVTCFFCHSVQSVDGAHNNPLQLARDGIMRASISDPFVTNRLHGAAYSPLLDRDRAESATMCGACHDIVSPHGAAIERTFSEWQQSVFSQPGGATPAGSTCGQCHMQQSTVDKTAADVPGAPQRRPHSHTFPAVDTAVTPFPDMQRQRGQVQAFLDTTLQSALCVEPLGGASLINVILDNVATGHFFPSGAAQDRRAWVEVVAYSGTNVLYSSGVVTDGTSVTSLADRDLWLLRDCIFDETGSQVDMFWQAASYEGNALTAHVTFDPSDPRFYQTHKIKSYPSSGVLPATPDRVTLRVRLQPVGLDVLDDLIASGDLAPQFRAAFTPFTMGGTLEWTSAAATDIYIDRATGAFVYCVTNTNLNVRADKFPAPMRSRCAP